MTRTLTILISLLIFLIPSPTNAQQPHWYVLLEPGNERWYRGLNSHDFHEIVTGYQDGYSIVERTHYYGGGPGNTYEERWLLEDNGDVWLGEDCYIDMPLEVGKSWGRTWGEWDQYYRTFTVKGWYDMWEPDCLWIQERSYDGSGEEFLTNRYYVDGIGLIHWEVTCFLCVFHLEPLTVDIETMSWDRVKALYRN